MNNRWNKVIYKFWAPIYDRFFNQGIFQEARSQLFNYISFSPGEKILFVGVGTGADLELIIDSKLDITAIDFSPDMLKQAKAKFQNSQVTFLEMDAQAMKFENVTFDYISASLILSVVPDANKCMSEIVRVLKPGGKIIIFDKFAPKGKRLPILKIIVRPFIRFMGTDIGLNFEDMYDRYKNCLTINQDEPVMMNGMYRKIILTKNNVPE